jgi:sialate O-acetylesterase
LLLYQREARRWEAAAARAKAAGAPFTEPPPARPAGPAESPWKPGAIFNGMVAPASRYPIRGVLWYQGESNTAVERAPYYARLFRTMISDWRRAWGQGDFPFLFVQLSSYEADAESDWPELRDAQRQALAVANTAMIQTIDIGEPANIHPKNKREVGRRLSLAARAVVYGDPVEYSGPLYRRVSAEPSALRVWFDHAAGLAARDGALRGFEVAGEDRKWHPAEARIDNSTVLVSSPAVPAPRYVRYAWADCPDANLYNAAGLPAAPFRSE